MDWKTVRGHLDDSEMATLQEFAQGKIYLEIGSGVGRSAIGVSDVAERVVAVDTFSPHENWQDQLDTFTTLYDFIKNVEGRKNINFFVGYSKDVVPMLKDNFFDVIFIDANHLSEMVCIDIMVALPKLKNNGIMAFHDWGWNTPQNKGVSHAVYQFFHKVERGGNSIAYVYKNDEYLISSIII
jgi:predicted O-methyltransferase YrrM